MPKRIKKRTRSKSRSLTRTDKPRSAPPAPTVPHSDPVPAVPDDGLTPLERLFVLEMLLDENQTQAYRRSHPDCTTDGSASVLAVRLLGKARVRAALEKQRTAQYKRLQVSADEALMIISRQARANPRDAYDYETGELLPFALWPENLIRAVKSFDPATGKVTLYDGQRAAELMAQAGGKLKNTVVLEFDHAAYLAREAPKVEKDGEA